MTASGGSSRTPLVVIGVVAAIGGLVAGVLLFFIAPNSREDDAVSSLAPAPVGCETSLEFDSSGTYYVFVEVSGEVGDLGDCENDDSSYEYDGPRPELDVELLDEDGETVRLRGDTSVSYDRGGQVGESLGKVQIDEPGEYQLRVAGGEDAEDLDQLMVRVGRDPTGGTGTLKLAGIGLFIVGVGLGALLMLLGRRGGGDAAQPPPLGAGDAAPGWQQAPPPTSPPTAPPTGPPPAGPPPRPPYPQPPSQPQPTQQYPQPPQPGGPPSPPRPTPDPGPEDERQLPPPSWGPPS